MIRPALQRIMTKAAIQAVARYHNVDEHSHRTRRQGRRHIDEDEPEILFDGIYQHPDREFAGLWPVCLRLLRWMLLGSVLLAWSALSCQVTVMTILPDRTAIEPLYFDYYSTRPTTTSTTALIARRRRFARWWSLTARRGPIGSCPPTSTAAAATPVMPMATVDLAHAQNFEIYHSTLTTASQHRRLQANQAYYLEVVMYVPASPTNYDAGMWSVITELYYSQSQLLAVSRRSIMLPYEVPWIRTLRQLAWSLPLALLGMSSSMYTLRVPVLRHYIENKQAPLQQVLVRIQPSTVQVVGGELRIGPELRPFQEILLDHYFLCLAAGTFLFAMFYLSLWGLVGLLWQRRQRQYEPPCELDPDNVHDPLFAHDEYSFGAAPASTDEAAYDHCGWYDSGRRDGDPDIGFGTSGVPESPPSPVETSADPNEEALGSVRHASVGGNVRTATSDAKPPPPPPVKRPAVDRSAAPLRPVLSESAILSPDDDDNFGDIDARHDEQSHQSTTSSSSWEDLINHTALSAGRQRSVLTPEEIWSSLGRAPHDYHTVFYR